MRVLRAEAQQERGWGGPQRPAHLLQGNPGVGLINLHRELGADALHLGPWGENKSYKEREARLAEARTFPARDSPSDPAVSTSSARRQMRSPASLSSGT